VNRLAVVGQPIAHSLSPAMHTAAFRALGMSDDWSYEAIELPPERFADGIGQLRDRGFVGVNVTVPHKLAALAVADQCSAAAIEIGAANTLSFTPAGIRADNTDGMGLIESLPVDPAGRSALVIGAGGAARAAIWALTAAGARVEVVNRTRARAAALATEFGIELLEREPRLPVERFEIVVNATSIGLAGARSSSLDPGGALKALGVAADRFSDHQVVVDLVYGTVPTALVAAASSAGATVVDGLEVLVRQGAESFRIWTGEEPPIDVMSAAVKEKR
jgi:shikimate dehydrogenase